MATRARGIIGAAVAVLALGLVALVVRDGDDGARAGLDATAEGSSTTGARLTTTTEGAGATQSTAAAPTSAAPTSAPSTTVAPGTTRPVPAPSPTTAPSGPSPPPPTGGLAAARVALAPVASVDYPIAMAVRPGDGALWIATKGGQVCRLQGSTCSGAQTVASVSTGGEQGLLGIAFSASGDRLYVSYTDPAGDTRLDEIAVGGDGAPIVASRRTVFTEDQPESNHNGGNVLLGPDGRLYLGLGDGGGAGDRHGSGDGNAQDPATDLGKILRIDPTASPPLVERWISGVRNPWRFSFDRATGDLWVGDVGQNEWEEVTRLAAGGQQGRNLGWRCYEGSHPYGSCQPAGAYAGPLFEYSHAEGCSVTGGYVYRGSRIPDLVGAYLFADYCNGAVRALTQSGGRVTLERHLGVDAGNVVSFGQDAAGELYVLTPSQVLRIDPA